MTATSAELSPQRRRIVLQNQLGQFAVANPRFRSLDAVQAYLQRSRVAEMFAAAVHCGNGWLRDGLLSAMLDHASGEYKGQGVSVYGGNTCVLAEGEYRYGIHLPTTGKERALDVNEDLPEGAYSAYWQRGSSKPALKSYGLPDAPLQARGTPAMLLLVARQAATDIVDALSGRSESVEAIEARLAELPPDSSWLPPTQQPATA